MVTFMTVRFDFTHNNHFYVSSIPQVVADVVPIVTIMGTGGEGAYAERQVGGAARPPRPPGEDPRAADPGRSGDAGERLTRRAQTPRDRIRSNGLHPGQGPARPRPGGV